MKSSSFGVPKPLAGQTGYKVNQTEVLEKEAKEMEIRLKNLQSRMEMQKLEDESIPKVGGARWKNAREDRGSIRSYAKDVQNRQQKSSTKSKRTMDLLTGAMKTNNTINTTIINNDPSKYTTNPELNISSPNSQLQQALQSNSPNRNNNNMSAKQNDMEEMCDEISNFKSLLPVEWSLDDVGDWLHSLNLSQYIENFRSNEITGEILMDISLDDLDYMKITVLAHRKTILKCVDELRKYFDPNQNSNIDIDATYKKIYKNKPNVNNTLTSKSLNGLPKVPNNMNDTDDTADSKSVKPPYTVHWSHLEPLSSNNVTNEPMEPNTADDNIQNLANQELDEEAERAAFTEAVMAWRNAGKTTTTKSMSNNNDINNNNNIQTSQSVSSSIIGDSTSWNDPFSNPQIDDNNDLFTDSNNKTNKKHTKIVKSMVSNTEKSDGSTSTITTSNTVITTKGNKTSIIHEPMSEEAERLEREEFQKAVMEWRRETGRGKVEEVVSSSKSNNNNNNNNSTSTNMESGVGTSVDTLYQPGQHNSVTDKLKEEMDKMYEQQAKLLANQKRIAQEQLDKVINYIYLIIYI
eukprot:TRINITY_DN67553_c14_g2_i3.p1 TRINITY_DN67553_c14_g2~~TRINITY_DN67553_c14_g2_i3.p1  ORF type:complete len:576 (-),score=40.09 TRINITY_DN67553_c14_g2_i3:379-2106(-)